MKITYEYVKEYVESFGYKLVSTEYDGEFHYRKMYEKDSFDILQIHDKRKDEYTKKHEWKLIRIPYWEFDNIENILNKEII